MEELIAIYRELLSKVNTRFVRYLHGNIDWNARLIAIIGARGVGKTTLLLQHIKLNKIENESLYVSADNIFFSKNSLFELAGIFYKYGGKFFFVDEVHKYRNWSQEIKNIYDSYPGLQIVFTGSSILDVYKGFGDLSRRTLAYTLYGLSFREFLLFEEGLEVNPARLGQIIENRIVINIEKPLPLFKKYLEYGYYPFYKEGQFNLRLNALINVVLEVDIPKYMEMRTTTIDKLKMLLQIIAESAPFKPNMSKIAEMIQVSRNILPDYFSYLERTKMILLLKNSTKGIRALGKLEKVYLDNTNLMSVLSPEKRNTGNIRETFFINQVSAGHTCTLPPDGDFLVNDNYLFEVGGKNKPRKQIAGLKNAFLVKDDIEYGYGNIIPLWYFGLLY
ncbi:ATPase [hydrothermal vent metagenome]|uniref:ATPase n=1 Tax=hydrothermal vent metagenome TaxID=652676 RepID=A0A3B0TSC5_9ZZZZ